MATLLHSESRRLYSWWWDSHISPKNSKWLQENLTDMDAKVKSMIKLIEEDADSFARRAEMYYKKRPELMKLVEEFYRAYRALAERYDHATVELRQAHRTITQTYTNLSYDAADDSQSSSSSSETGPQTPEIPHPTRALFDLDDLQKDSIGISPSSLYSDESDYGMSKKGLKQLNEMLKTKLGLMNLNIPEEKESNSQDGFSKLSEENKNLKSQIQSESERARKAEFDVESLQKTIEDMQSEREAVLAKYQMSLDNLSNLEKDLHHLQKEARAFNDRATKAESKKRKLKASLLELEAERDEGLLQNKQCLERISKLEAMLSVAQNDAKGHSERAIEAESEAQKLKLELSTTEADKEAGILQYKQCLEKISSFEKKLLLADEWAAILNEQKNRAETEVNMLRQALNCSNGEKEALALQYKQCLETITMLKNELICAQEDAKRLNKEILIGKEKLKSTEEQVSLLDRSNQSLRTELVTKGRELLDRNEELGKLQICLEDEQSRISELEAALFTSQELHDQSQEQQKALATELRNGLRTLKEMDVSKHGLEEEIRRVKEENQCLNELNLSSTKSMQNMKGEITSLKEMKEKLEEEASRQVKQSDLLEEELCVLKEEIKDLNGRYQALMKQVASVGFPLEHLASSMKDLQDENSKLKDICKNEKSKKQAALESSLLDMSAELDRSKEKIKELQEFFQFLQGEKSNIVLEKAALFSHLQTLTENIQNLWAKNALLENSLANANVELACLREKSKFLDEICQLLRDEKSNLITERDALFMQMTNAQGGLEKLENRFTELEEKYTGLEKEKTSLERCFNLLRDERKLTKKDFEEELDKAVNAQVEIFILQKFIEDLEEKNLSLVIECQKHADESQLSDKLIVELESENLEQQMEAEFLVDEIEKLRKGIARVFKALQIDIGTEFEDKIESEHSYLLIILQWIERMKYSALKSDDDRQKLQVENLVLVALLEQLKSEGVELEAKIDQDLTIFKEKSEFLQEEICTIIGMNTRLRLEVSKADEDREMLYVELDDLQMDYLELQDSNLKVLEENELLLSKYTDLEETKEMLEYEKGVISLIFKSFGTEKALELKLLDEEMKNKLQEVLKMNFFLNDQVSIEKKSLLQKERELAKVEYELNASQDTNRELCRIIETLKRNFEESKLMGDKKDKRVFELMTINTALTKDIESLHEKIEEHKIREDHLSSELQEKSNEFELWEAEAATFYFDFQFSAIREVLAENKVNELTGVCDALKQESASKSMEIEQMNEKLRVLESETGRLKAQLSAYIPAIVSLKDDIASLENMSLFRTKLKSTEILESEDTEGDDEFHEKNCLELAEDKDAVIPHGIMDLQKMRSKIKAVEKAVMGKAERLSKQKSVRTKTKPKACMKEIESPRSKLTLRREKTIQKEDDEITESRNNGTRMKDILLDQPSDCAVSVIIRRKNGAVNEQMLELWQTAEQNCTTNTKVKELIKHESASMDDNRILSRQFSNAKNKKIKDPFADLVVEKELGVAQLELSASFRERSKEGNKRRILERLTSDAQKLMTIQVLIQDLRKKTGTINKKSKKGGAKDLEYETTKEHLQEVEETAVQLMDINCQLQKNIETPSYSDVKEVGFIQRKRVLDQARKGSEKIGRLQLEVQKIQYGLIKLEDEKKNKMMNRFSKSNTSIALRNFIHIGRSRSIKRRKKPCVCGCLRPATPESEVSN